VRACILRYRLRQSWHRGQAGTSAWVLPGQEIKLPRADRGRSRPRKPASHAVISLNCGAWTRPRRARYPVTRRPGGVSCRSPNQRVRAARQHRVTRPCPPPPPSPCPTPAPPGLPELAWRYSKDEATTTPLLDYSRCHALDDDPADCRLHRALTACPTGSDLRRREYRTGISGTTSKRLGPPRQSQIIGIDLISYQNDRKSCTATVGNVERA